MQYYLAEIEIIYGQFKRYLISYGGMQILH